MSLRLRICLCFFLIVAVGLYYVTSLIVEDIRPHLLGSIEESLVDTSTILAALVGLEAERALTGGALPAVDRLRAALELVTGRTVAAQIYDLLKTRVDLRVYVTDGAGRVVFDSDGGRDEGADYSRWNDVYLTLRGKYGARTTHFTAGDPYSATLYVASPILAGDQTVGVLTVCKPTSNPNRFIATAKRKIAIAGVAAGVALVLLGIVTTFWITRPLQRLTAYARAIRDGRRMELPELGRSEIGVLGRALEEMRESLEGKEAVERYVQSLTHELKSPVAAIRGAAELLAEEMPPERRAQFAGNIVSETGRIADLVDRLLFLASVESRRGLKDEEELDLQALVQEIVTGITPLFEAKRLSIEIRSPGPARIVGERFLVRQAIGNILQNALDFTPPGGTIRIEEEVCDDGARIAVTDTGPGIPDYALSRVFDRFYSLRRPETGRKGSGLGLSIAKEVAELHGGTVTAENSREGGARVTITFPIA
ncbi:MAG: two-component system sensor histidine kinase CreC [Planctomycetota bacterium]